MPNFMEAVHRKSFRLMQIVATMVVAVGPFSTGLGKGFSSPALASMQIPISGNETNHRSFTITEEEGSWVASLSLLGAFCGGIPGGLAMKLGRKKVILLIALPFSGFWYLTVFASCVQMVYASSFICGMCSAMISLATPVYISEIADSGIRGGLCSIAKLAANIGMLTSFWLGIYLDWRNLAIVASLGPALLFLLVIFIPETPSFLLYNGKDNCAEHSLRWFRCNQDVSRELETMKTNISRIKEEDKLNCGSKRRSNLVKPLLITCGLMIFQKFSGANAFNFYAVPILSKVFVGINPYSAACLVALIQILAGMMSSILIDTAGRLPLLIISNALMSAALAGFGTFIYINGKHTGELSAALDWIPLTCAIIFQIAFALGISPISWLYIGELFPLQHRGLGAIANSVSYACSFASVKTFVDFQLLLGLHGAFWLYSVISVVGLLFVIFVVPETKCTELQEMNTSNQMPDTYTKPNCSEGSNSKLLSQQSNSVICS